MKYRFILLFAVSTFAFAASAASPREEQWRRVQEAVDQGLPRTALEALEPIITGAVGDRAWAEAAKAIGRRIALQTEVEGRQPAEAITRLAAELAAAPPELAPLFHTLLADAYWGYFRQNRWRFVGRTATAEAPGADFLTWDLRRLFAEIDRHFTAALAASAPLQATPIADFDTLLTPGTLPDAQRPTLYDFLVHEALEFYQAGEQGLARPEDAFVVPADSPALGPVTDFLRWEPATPDTASADLKALRLHQAILRFHERDADPTAFIAADLDRLLYAHGIAVGPTKDERLLAALRTVAAQRPQHELSARARLEWARILERQGDRAEAHRVAGDAAREFPTSPWAALCRNLVRQIEAREVTLVSERVWTAPWPDIALDYRNVDQVWFRVVASDWEEYLDRRRPRPENLNRNQRLELLRRPPTFEWSANLPPTPDFQTRHHELPVPATLAPGFYFLFASHRADFSEDDNQVSVTEVWVSDLALVVRPREGQLEGFVLDARSGEPVAGATVEAWYLASNGERVAVPAVRTDDLGVFVFPARTPPQRGHLVRARHGTRQVALASDIWWSRPDRPPRSEVRTMFLTDRAIYRPGQLVQYKGICFRHQSPDDTFELLEDREVTVVFRDPNNQEIARQTHRSGRFGSFSGSFTAPRTRLLGRMRLEIEGTPASAAWFQVEEYKRPKFQVTLDPPRTAPRLDDSVTVEGRAMAYTGAAIDAGRVTWRVTRQVRFPVWWGWFRGGWPPMGTENQEIAHGTAETGVDGSFRIAFPAVPDRSVPETDEPTFEFEVHADVTDTAGETRSADRTVRVGYAALQMTLETTEWQQRGRPVELRVLARTLDGEPQASRGVVRIHRLKEPDTVHRRPLGPGGTPWRGARAGAGPATNDLSDPNQWDLGSVVAEQAFQTGTNGLATNRFDLASGLYRAVLETADPSGRKLTARLPIRVLDPEAERLALRLPHLLAAREWRVEPGADFEALWGTGYESGRAFVEIEHRGRMRERFWTAPGRTQQRLRVAVTEAMRGGFTLHVTQVRENRAYLEARHVDVPWTNQELDLSWETFRPRLEPGQPETWTAVIKPKRPGTAPAAVAEMAAVLYDASLDAFAPHAWPDGFGFWPVHHSTARPFFSNEGRALRPFLQRWRREFENVDLRHRSFPPDLRFENLGGRFLSTRGGAVALADSLPAAAPSELRQFGGEAVAARGLRMAKGAGDDVASLEAAPAPAPGAADGGGAGPGPAASPDLSVVTPRRNLAETAFFLPHLTSDSNGVVRLAFTMPEALTEWRFLGFAHDRGLRSGRLEGRTVTARDIMVQPQPPRFLREGDELEFTVKVSNQSDTRQQGRVRLTFAFALDGQPADAALANTRPELPFDIPARESRAFGWRLRVPDGCGFLTFKAVAATARHSDGEEGALPVLVRRVFLTESLPLPIRGPGERRFVFERLRAAADSTTLRHEGLTVQMVSQPGWYAVLALPYLMEFPHECSEQVFNRYYANAIAAHLARRDPKIRAVFDQWRGTAALDSPLEKNEDLKAAALAETPWVRAARNESEARRNVAVLFEADRLAAEQARALERLAELRGPDGGWPWFPGGRRNDFITLYIVTGFGRLRQLGAEVPVELAVGALDGLDAWMQERWERLRDDRQLDGMHLDAVTALYLYGRSFFLRDLPVAEPRREALAYWLAQARQHWLKLERQSQGHVALALARFGGDGPDAGPAVARAIVRSLKERSVTDDELGRFWRDTERSWWWHRAPIETQALMIEVFDEVAGDADAVEELKVWLLKQKQTQDWKTTKATADAVYALLRRGADLLAGNRLVEVEIGGRTVGPAATGPGSRPGSRPEPGTGFYEVHFAGPEVTGRLADILVRKADRGVAWGSVHWQYFEDLAKVTPYTGTPLTLTKTVFTRVNTRLGPELRSVQGPLRVGDELLVRLELRVDRDMEYVHLKDQRGSGTEPVNVLSGYRFQDGLAYYETTRDTASDFFIDYLPKGTYVFEYPLRVQHRGAYATGVAQIQCMYAPEFNSHSGSIPLQVE